MIYRDQNIWHETEQDRANEREVMQIMCDYTRCTARKEEGEQDFRVSCGGKYVAVVEIKTRRDSFYAYRTYKLDVGKIDKLKARAVRDGVAGVLVVSWAVEGLPGARDVRWLDVKGTDFSKMEVKPFKRGDRDEKTDLGYCIPTELFKVVPLKSNDLPVEA
jgi:hypothetical protein